MPDRRDHVHRDRRPRRRRVWADDTTGTPVWIQLTGTGESPIDITTGTTLLAAGAITDPAAVPTTAADERTIARGFILTVRYEDLVPG